MTTRVQGVLVLKAIFLAACVGLPAIGEELPEDFDIAAIPNRSDDRLNDSRITCAAGQIRVADQRASERYGVKQRDAAKFCPAIVAEAIRRGNDADLYSAMQPGKATEELQAVLVAAASGQNQYVNAQGVSKQLTCHLAFDVGYIYGHANPDQAILADLSDAAIDATIAQCYETDEGIAAGSAIWAGARLAQRHLTE